MTWLPFLKWVFLSCFKFVFLLIIYYFLYFLPSLNSVKFDALGEENMLWTRWKQSSYFASGLFSYFWTILTKFLYMSLLNSAWFGDFKFGTHIFSFHLNFFSSDILFGFHCGLKREMTILRGWVEPSFF